MRLPAALCKMQRKRREIDGFSKSTWMTPPGSHPTSGFGARHSLPKFFRHKNAASYKNEAAKTRISTVDIPTGLDPRTKQQPTGLIACPASPMDFPDRKYDHQASDFQDEAIWDVIWLTDK